MRLSLFITLAFESQAKVIKHLDRLAVYLTIWIGHLSKVCKYSNSTSKLLKNSSIDFQSHPYLWLSRRQTRQTKKTHLS